MLALQQSAAMRSRLWLGRRRSEGKDHEGVNRECV